MRAGFIEEPGKAYFKEVPEPQIEKSTDVKIKVVVTGICGSEVHAYNRSSSNLFISHYLNKFPREPGK